MCESSAFLLGKNNELTRVMENVVDVTPTNGKVYLTDLLGEEKILDGMGGGIGAQIISSLREELPTYIEIYALGTNSIATSAMMKSHANKGATGENAIVVSSKKANIIVAPIAVTMPNTMMGEVTSKISEAICDSEALKILLPIMPENFSLVGVENKPLSLLIKDTIKVIKKEFNIK